MGEPVSQGSSRLASAVDYERTAKAVSEVAGIAADQGVEISIEIHQNSIADNSWSALHLLELIDAPNVGVNPDLGNIYWTYDIPEESCEDAIVALAQHVNYWHCKSLYRVHIPDLETAIYVQAPLPDGEIDYRFRDCGVIRGQLRWVSGNRRDTRRRPVPPRRSECGVREIRFVGFTIIVSAVFLFGYR